MQHKNSQLFTINLRSILAVISVIFVVFFVLLSDRLLPISISSIIEFTEHAADKKHFIVLAILPIYIAAMIFGAAIIGIYMGTWLESLFTRKRQKLAFSDPEKSA